MYRFKSIRRRVLSVLVVVYLVSMAATAGIGWMVLKADAVKVAQEKTDLFMGTMNAARRYMVEHLRPQTKELLPGTYFPEGSVGIVMLASIGRMLQEDHPEYVYRIASPNALNPANRADDEEGRIIARFANRGGKQWDGFIERNGQTYYTVATPMKAKPGCMRCHSVPDAAPKALVAKYGSTGGFGYKNGEVVGATFAYMPISIALDEARQKLAVFIAAFSLFFLIVLFIVDRVLVSSVIKPIERFVDDADAVSKGDMSRSFEVNSEDEMQTLAKAFNRMKVSIQKSLDMLRRKR